jgi:hypothetical protein
MQGHSIHNPASYDTDGSVPGEKRPKREDDCRGLQLILISTPSTHLHGVVLMLMYVTPW